MSIDAAASRQFALVAKAIAFIRAQGAQAPTLEEIAAAVGLSAQALERVLADWADISPQRFLHYLSRTYPSPHVQWAAPSPRTASASSFPVTA